jgi:hypothetical protein
MAAEHVVHRGAAAAIGHMENLRTDLRELKGGNAKRLDNVEGSVSDLDREAATPRE